ncbi:hypothetical protein [Magnetospirillum sp. 15-1]|uniref:hypothetical protein n=1 Tax=Magnetospirillum sp. 15-1 TaxID=1979370 RepID=UPI000BBCCA0A|nr:hypothetical protein [Magnetospirillum sp. 15-1]
MTKIILAMGAVLLLAGCGAGRWEPFGGITDPVCMPDGSVSFYQQADDKGNLGTPRATKENCPWNKPAAAK